MTRALFACLILNFATSLATAADAREGFAAGNQAYEQGKFAEAAVHYRMALSNGVAGEGVWFNLGNAEFKAGKLGRAIAAYRRAEQITPRDPALRANLGFARKKATGEEKGSSTPIQRVLQMLTPNEWATLASLGATFVFAYLAFTEWRRLRYGSGSLMVFVVLATVLSLGCAASFWRRYRTCEAVTTATQSAVRFGPLEDSQTAFQLNDGAEVRVLDASGEWLHVRDAAGRTGWAKRDDMTIVSP